jgi:predicted ATP-dependent endonuclease of OLD family
MKFNSFTIKNFKGIEKATFNIKRNSGNIFTIIGLNESGKTTILEAINFLTSKNFEDHQAVVNKDSSIEPENFIELIPLAKLANFNDSISVEVSAELSEDDIIVIKKHMQEKAKEKPSFRKDIIFHDKNITIERRITFKNSKKIEAGNYWTVNVFFKNGRKQTLLLDSDEEWQDMITLIRTTLIPKVLFFPTFSFDFPEIIFLEDNPQLQGKEANVDKYYRDILTRILKIADPTTDLNTHVLARLKSGVPEEVGMAEHMLLKMETVISDKFFKRWDDIFKKDKRLQSRRDIKIKYYPYQYPNNSMSTFTLSFQMNEGGNIYNIAQRSLGFRWFFSFILFTEIQACGTVDRNVIFLLDEPAANLHSSAQEQILSSFKDMSKSGHQIIFSTHSQYLIEPNWLENAYICKNESMNYSMDGIESYANNKAKITITPYRQFVSDNPSDTTYFQPVLDLLNVKASKIEDVKNAVIMEGKDDFYTINYFNKLFCDTPYDFCIVPGTGAEKEDAIIRLYMAWAKKFIIVLDGDDDGKKAAENYKKDYLLSDKQIKLLTDFNADWEKIEYLVSKEDKEKFNLKKKKEINIFFRNLLLEDKKENLSEETINNFRKLLSDIDNAIKRI